MITILFTAIMFLIIIVLTKNRKWKWVLGLITVIAGNLLILLAGLAVSTNQGYMEKIYYISFPIDNLDIKNGKCNITFTVDELSPDHLTIDRDNVVFTISQTNKQEFRLVEERVVLNKFWKYFFVPYIVSDTINCNKYYEITLPVNTLTKVR